MKGPVSFGYKMAWLAVRSEDATGVAAGLGVREVANSAWGAGVEAIYSHGSAAGSPVFITPPLDGWVLVASPAYFEEVSDIDPERLLRFVTGVARDLGTEVQFFATHRVVEGHAWARADETGASRAFSYLGETGERLLNHGSPTGIEGGLACFDADADEPPDESTVMAIAGAWSLDPTQIEERYAALGRGFVGIVLPGTRDPECR